MNTEQLSIISVGYTNWSELGILTRHDQKLHGLNFSGILAGLESVLEERLVVPVIDGLPGGTLKAEQQRRRGSPIEPHIFRAFIANVHYGQHVRVAGDLEASMSIKGYRNIVEPTFSDSEHSPMLQLADVVSYLLMVQDSVKNKNPSGFKARVAKVAWDLVESLVRKERVKMTIG